MRESFTAKLTILEFTGDMEDTNMSSYDKFSMNSFRLDGKVAMVTGANTGLGIAYAVAFAKAGADVFIPHMTDETDQVRAQDEAQGRKLAFCQGDLTDMDYLNSLVPKCVEALGRLDILVNNAGMGCFYPFEEFPDRMFDKVLSVNLEACYYLGRQAGLHMAKNGGGKIINIGSALSYTADCNCPPYVVAKHGVIGLTRSFANELGKYNIQCNALCPGFLATEVNAAQRENKAFTDKITNRTPAGRWGDVSDLMGTAVYLASPASDYVNGWNISIDGGFTCTL